MFTAAGDTEEVTLYMSVDNMSIPEGGTEGEVTLYCACILVFL